MTDRISEISRKLRRLASEIEDTATGSSRVEMYKSIASAVREEASKVDALSAPPAVDFRATKH